MRVEPPSRGLLVELGPDPRAGAEGQQAYGLAAIAERHHEQPRASVLAALRVANHRTLAIINLRFLPRGGDDDRTGLRGLRAAELRA